MPTEIAVAILALVGTLATAAASVAAAWVRQVKQGIGDTNGLTLARQIEIIRLEMLAVAQMLRDHMAEDARRFAQIDARLKGGEP